MTLYSINPNTCRFCSKKYKEPITDDDFECTGCGELF